MKLAHRNARKLAFVSSAGVALASALGFTLVTSDGPGTHAADPLVPVFGIDHVGVGRMFIMFPGSPTPGICTASLLTEGGRRYAITAAHCLSDGASVLADAVTVRFTTPGGIVTATASKALGQIHVHPLFDGDTLHGYDVAILEFTDPVDPIVPSYDLIDPSTDGPVIGLDSVKVGFGTSGFGATGDTIAAGVKRAGLNKWESEGLGSLGVAAPAGFAANDTQLTYDFDGPTGANNSFAFYFGFTDPGYGGDEVMVGVGDSGGPTFVFATSGTKLAGVASYRTRVIPDGMGGLLAEVPGAPFPASPDVDGIINSTWGEFAADANLSHPDLMDFIADTIATEPCPADTNGDGMLSPADFSAWIAAFNAMSPACDQNADALCTPADFSAWVANFNAGC